ncbi:16S rRNA (cytidine(1402)-2'-O)-methyltransferase [Wansuia hejianensis]|uniref:Ribosomal RNA small subunit methyltransferase I n=1 Tax=Wansuia hejianensis TaxID=2763667 RepID=A0A926IMA6_9FIRM|nr:16S rRNA (cytidine(1402)-2'-O)-methyltransferase [Wansuia hejianensis]MBC8590235.1 16S rRNA (cytidine(1402)-2'-O)-methyltransferase [Wansuia hejianensis]
MEKGKLYICPTPIGNLEDITLRTLRILEEVDLIAAEDTRHTIKLLNHYKIKKPLTSYHEHNEKEKGSELIDRLHKGENIALVSDAGMPGISDPGQEVISMAIREDIEVIVLPGATASITALVSSGLSTNKFVFEGFLSSKKKDRRKELEELKKEKRTIIFYESPHRLLNTLNDMIDIIGNRNISIAREITKLYEEIFRGKIQEAMEKFSSTQVKGEFVLIVEGNDEEIVEKDIDIKEKLKEYIEDGYSKKESVKLVAQKYEIPKNQVYKESLEI